MRESLLEAYNYMMCAVPQVLGFILALIFAGYYIWLDKINNNCQNNNINIYKELIDLNCYFKDKGSSPASVLLYFAASRKKHNCKNFGNTKEQSYNERINKQVEIRKKAKNKIKKRVVYSLIIIATSLFMLLFGPVFIKINILSINICYIITALIACLSVVSIIYNYCFFRYLLDNFTIYDKEYYNTLKELTEVIVDLSTDQTSHAPSTPPADSAPSSPPTGTDSTDE